MTRPVNMIGNVVARALTSVPSEVTARMATKTRSLPNMSPTRPRIGVQMEALSRYPVSNQATASAEACRECSRDGRAGMIRDCRMLNAMADTAKTTNVT